MSLTEKLLPVALLGAEWVLWVLVALSVISVAIMIERLWYFSSTAVDNDTLFRDLKALLGKGDVDKAKSKAKGLAGIEGEVLRSGLGEYARGSVAVEKAMAAA